MIAAGSISHEIQGAVESAVRDLVHVTRVGEAYYVNLPMLYPDGSFVTVRIDRMTGTGIRVSDAGFAYREVDDLDASRSFKRTANKVAETTGVDVGERVISVEANIETIERAIFDVAGTSWRVANVISERIFEEDDVVLSAELSTRLKAVFGSDKVCEGEKIVGASTVEWPVSAIVLLEEHKAVFQAVNDQANSIYRASTAFRDISSVTKQIRLIAFVRSKAILGPRLALLAPARVVEEGQSDESLRKAAA